MSVVRKVVFFALCVVFISVSVVYVADAKTPVAVVINGIPLVMDSQPVIKGGRLLVPLRAIFEALGASVEWDEISQRITGRKNDVVVALRVNEAVASVRGKSVALEAAPSVVNGRTKVPVRFIAESLGADVKWVQEKNTVFITVPERKVVTPAPTVVEVLVTAITDGDTIRVILDGKDESVRFIGVDAPETVRPSTTVEPFGREAASFVDKLLRDKTVWLEFDVQQRDRFGRLLAYVWLSQPSDANNTTVRANVVNALLLERGFARVSTFKPNVKYVELFTAVQDEARKAGRGLWGSVQVKPPVTTGGVVIVSVALSEEVVTLKNSGTKSVDISGWVLVSEVGNQRFTFPRGTVISAGGTLAIVSGSTARAGAGRIVWGTSNIWNNDGDPAILLDASGREISRRK